MDKIEKAKTFARKAHGKQLDDSGENYYYAHVQQVGRLVEMVTKDKNVIAAAYLHDVLEDTTTRRVDIRKAFGQKVLALVLEVTHEGEKDDYGYYFPRLKTKDGIMIKFADRLSNLSRVEPWPEKRRAQYLKRSKFWKDGSGLFPTIRHLSVVDCEVC